MRRKRAGHAAEAEGSGSPDPYGQGGIGPEITRDGKPKRLYLGNDENALPPSLVPGAPKVRRVMSVRK